LPASGRGALFQILRHTASGRGEGSVALPDYVCASVIDAVVAAGFTPSFYRVADDLHAERASLRAALDASPVAALFVSYFGLVDLTADLAFARETNPGAALLKDDVHAPLDVAHLRGADYAFTSLRKALPVPDGALVTPPFAMILDDQPASAFALAKLAGGLAKDARRFEPAEDSSFLALLRQGEELLDGDGAYRAARSWMSASLLEGIDRDAVAARRRRNFVDLAARIEPLGLRPIVPLAEGSVPLFLPVRLAGRDAVRQELAGEGIFCPAHWPAPAGALGVASAARLYESELSLVIDQRYDAADMERIAAVLVRSGAKAA